jgi:DNA-directed RNA polymerase specialized sigma24 family protein
VAIVLRYLEGLSEAETAEIMDCSVGTVKSSTSRALVALRSKYASTTTADAAKGLR